MQDKWLCLKQSKLGDSDHTYCDLCKGDFPVVHTGRDDCHGHVLSNKYSDCANLLKNNGGIKMGFFFSNKRDHDVLRAEAMTEDLVVKLNLPMTAADCISKPINAIFHDSEIARKVQCCWYKATTIVKEIPLKARDHLTAKSIKWLLLPVHEIITDGV